jgi:hypothetical protein
LAVERARRPLRGIARIAQKVGAILDRRHIAKHFEVDIADDRFAFPCKAATIAAEAALGGSYAIRTSVPADKLDDAATVAAYKNLSRVERAFRSLKTVDLDIRPLFHHRAPRGLHSLLADLATFTRNEVTTAAAPNRTLIIYPRLTPIQHQAFDLLGIDPTRTQ